MKQILAERAISRSGERGGARVKFVIVALLLGAVGYFLYLYIPVRYDAYVYQDLMQHYVDVASAAGYPATWVKDQLTKSATEYNVPTDAVVTSSVAENRVVARVQFTRLIVFPGYTYSYEFDHTVKSTAFLSIR